jgi:hypothetical protein
MKIELKIPDPPEGWVFDGVRDGRVGERFYNGVAWYLIDNEFDSGVWGPIAVKSPPPWEPSPELVAVLNPGWIALDHDGDWYWFDRRPVIGKYVNHWLGNGECCLLTSIKSHLLPKNIPWKESLREIK